MTGPIAPPRRLAAVAGLVAGAAALGAGELLAGLVPGARSLVVAIGDLVISLQPPGAKQFVVDLVGEADKLVLNLLIVAVALVGAGALGVVGIRRPALAGAGYIAVGGLAFLAALRDPLTDPIAALVVATVAVAVAIGVLRWLMRLAAPVEAAAEMPDWGRRRFIGASVALGAVAVGGGLLGRLLLERASAAQVGVMPVPSPVEPLPALPAGASLEVPGITPIVVPNEDFYRIDTALLVPRPNVADWRLQITGMVDRPFELTYDELLALPLYAQYVTIACVSNEVGGNLVGNALWTGARLREILDRAGVQEGATQIVGFSVDGFSAGFPTAWVTENPREALVAVAMNGEPLPPAHGYPARLIVPGLFGYVSATKWLSEIRLTTLEDFDGYWVPLGWAKEAPILTQSRIDTPRDGASVAAGRVPIAGVAWAPDRGIVRVEVSIDGGEWAAAELSTPISNATWVQWVYRWDAQPGSHTLTVRAHDGNGDIQTSVVTPPPPDGARGHHSVRVTVG
jgi:DMSO/TMAO reductase YedYZ molybdopterin-dependent catalytic subunit